MVSKVDIAFVCAQHDRRDSRNLPAGEAVHCSIGFCKAELGLLVRERFRECWLLQGVLCTWACDSKPD